MQITKSIIGIFNNHVHLISGTNRTALCPVKFRHEHNEKRVSTVEKQLHEISLEDEEGDEKVMKNTVLLSEQFDSRSLSAVFSLETIERSEDETILYAVVDVIQEIFTNIKDLHVLNPVMAVEPNDGDIDVLMLGRPYFNYPGTTSSLSIPLWSVVNSADVKIPKVLARLTWRIPQLPGGTKTIRFLMSCSIGSISLNQNDENVDDDYENRLNIASKHFDVNINKT